MFGQVYFLFVLPLGSQQLQIVVVKEFKTLRPQNRITSYIELDVPNLEPFQFIWQDSIIRVTHVMPPTPDNPRYVVQDLFDGDMYLRLR